MSFGTTGAFSGYSLQSGTRKRSALVLDLLSVPARAAYSFRRLRGAYTGPLVRLRRTTDNTEADFGAGSDGFVSESEVLAWVGAGNTARCVTIYDQSGNGFHATQATAANQPEVVGAGVYRGGVASTGANNQMSIPAGAVAGLTTASVSTVAARLTTSYPGYHKIGSSGSDTHHPFGDFNIYTDFFSTVRVAISGGSAPGIGIKHVLTEINDGATLTVYQKNILRGSAGITFSTPTIRNFPAPTANGVGLACGNELILFGSALIANDRNLLTSNQISAWSIV